MEAGMWRGATSRSQLQKSINSLQALNNVPEAPTENPISSEIDQSRRLLFSREKEIVSNLAFLSATTDNKLKVMAVCVEEHSNGEGITIRIASNSGDLSAIRDGFIEVGGILERAARRENSRSEDIEALFRHIVVLDFNRILSRLRSRHSKSTKKLPFITQLHNAVNDRTFRSTASLTNGTKDLQDLFTRLEKIPDIKAEIGLAHSIIRDIVTQANVLISPSNLSLLLNTANLEPTSKTYLPDALRKLTRYYSAANSLVCAARDKKCSVFHTILIEPFSISLPPGLHKTHIKVHAEIQLLFFYEQHADLPRPRIICSSKSACYLCNLFFKLHGVFHISRSHGRLYDKWILPDWLEIPPGRRAELADLATQMDAALVARIRIGCIKREYPPESVASIPLSWPPSTIHTSSSSSTASTSTIRPQSPLHQAGSQDAALSQLSSMLPTPPWTPSAQISTPISSPLPLIPEEPVQVPSSSPCIIITSTQLPYTASITSLTPPILLHFDKPPLKLDFDFSHALPCRLLITKGADSVGEGGEYRVVDIRDIPTATEMQVASLERKPREVKFQLQGVCVAVTWG